MERDGERRRETEREGEKRREKERGWESGVGGARRVWAPFTTKKENGVSRAARGWEQGIDGTCGRRDGAWRVRSGRRRSLNEATVSSVRRGEREVVHLPRRSLGTWAPRARRPARRAERREESRRQSRRCDATGGWGAYRTRRARSGGRVEACRTDVSDEGAVAAAALETTRRMTEECGHIFTIPSARLGERACVAIKGLHHNIPPTHRKPNGSKSRASASWRLERLGRARAWEEEGLLL